MDLSGCPFSFYIEIHVSFLGNKKRRGLCNFHFVVQDLCLPKLVENTKENIKAILGKKKKTYALYYYCITLQKELQNHEYEERISMIKLLTDFHRVVHMPQVQ